MTNISKRINKQVSRTLSCKTTKISNKKISILEQIDNFFVLCLSSSLLAKILLERMNALETYPPFNHREAAELSASSEYAHVKSYSRGRMCGTLSKYEWEASCKFNGCDLNQYVISSKL